MTAWNAGWRFPLYLRIWLAVIVTVGLLTIAVGYLWRVNTEQTPMREVIIRDQNDEVIGQSMVRPTRVPGQGVEFDVQMKDGRVVTVQLPPRPRPPGERPGGRPWLPRGPQGFLWLLGMVGLAVAIGSYPIVRRLTVRLEDLRRGVERWGEGDLSVRVPERGNDEVAFLAQRFNQAAERVDTLVQSHRSLLANASHELRSPLARIRMGLELMDPEPSERSRAEITRNIAELDQLVDEILLASRLDARASDIGTFESVDLTGLAAEEAARTGADLEVAEGEGTVVVQGVAKLLRRALRNLLENARRYSNGPVQITVRRLGSQAEVRVCDRGPGVPEAERERIFEPFYRLRGASEREGSVGLGLALVRSIATRHHGEVHCEENPGGGACFVLTLACDRM
ncbi:HAMP domain-containing histidine kinase [Ramlibacter sp. XY19]|uniref:HAMP domain-containing sensor histidine kinase n=1 Tax=Ramlibacter paludis TaxID=2908000 RepID=UPI0023DC9E0F|nr:HAMP domain-containing sensor histidine kinase [Ramlibacter paludis]MCG2595651.1 HAMP domain-containing histidine kinase [Ramlibacter paludis]